MSIYQKASVLSFSGDERLNEVKRSLQNKVKQTVMHPSQKMGQMENILAEMICYSLMIHIGFR